MSVRREGHRVATAEVRCRNEQWRLVQVKARMNRPATAEIVDAVKGWLATSGATPAREWEEDEDVV